jgi:LmbE family N-acetylglucosaminyl deacetylase
MEFLGSVLGVWAHPDDETYLSAGIMAYTVSTGGRMVCVTATRGEEGSWDEERWPTATMGEVREAELMRCLEILGVSQHHWLDLRDGTCADLDFEEGVGRVEGFMTELAPDSVLTFGPDGMTDHADHKAVSAWTTEAFRRSANPGARLYYATQTPEWAERFVPVMQRFDVFGPGTPPVTERQDLGVAFALEPDLLERKLRAIDAHESQVEGMMNAFGRDFFRESMREETFRLGAEA